MTTQEIIDYYAALLILQYRSQDKALAHVAAWVAVCLQNQIIDQTREAFDVETAIGDQLNILGLYRGVPRVIYGLAAGTYWSMIPYGDSSPNSYFGWGVYADTDPPTDRFLMYADLNRVAYALTDMQMRLLIELKARFDSWDGTLAILDNILYDFFGTYVTVQDNGDMTMVYVHQSVDPDPNHLWLITNTAGFLPAPAGVSYTVLEV